MQFLLLSFGCLSVFFSLTDSKSYNAQPSNALKRGYRSSSVAEFRPINDDDEYAVGDDQAETSYNNGDYTAVDIAPAPDSNYDQKPGGNADVYYPTDDYRVSRDYDDYVSPQACGYDANGTLCGFNCSYSSNYYYYECDSVYQRCTYDRLDQVKCKYTVGVNVGSLCSINDKGEYFCGDDCEFTSTKGDSISCKSIIFQCKFTDDSLISCKFNTTYVYPQKCEVVQSNKTQICGYNCTYSEDGTDMKCKDTYQTCQLTDDNEYVCEFVFDVDSGSCTKESHGNWKCNGLDCEKNKEKKLVCTQKTSYYYYDDARVRGIELDGCGQSSYGDMQICGSNCIYGYQGHINCSVISKICNYNGNAYLMGDSKGQCMYNTQTVQADLCGMNEKGDNICGYNCSYAAANSYNIKCEKVYQTCGYDADDTYHCKYAPDYVMPSACGNDPDGNSICGQECSYVIDEELMCKYLDYKCNYEDSWNYWCLYNRSNTAEDYCDKEDGKWVCQDGCYVDKEKNVWCYENSTQTSYDYYEYNYHYTVDEGCGNHVSNTTGEVDSFICGLNCSVDRDYNMDCEIVTKNCSMDEEGAEFVDYDSCEYNKTHVFNEVCSYFDNNAYVCGRNCIYSNGVNVTCSTNFTSCTYSPQTYAYDCVYDKNYVLSSACGFDINHATICGNDCTHKYGNETIDCKTINTTCSFDEWGSTLCHYNISTNSQQGTNTYCINGYCDLSNCTEKNGFMSCYSNSSDYNEYNYDCKINSKNQLICQQLNANCSYDSVGLKSTLKFVSLRTLEIM
ncbi:hypothetical protein WR25_02733 isoform B [Diploscapter pachys]|uniref:Uncharacterized protein n=1 Tax=Diploscapter pachys TaxID=2018661 RepID=A0A2A2JQH9_9BILA|nr:hypothetical protein WR25_02733 isoform B [Diploscapter pachys]